MSAEAARGRGRVIRSHAFGKINLTLRVVGVRPDGYHALRTTFQSLALHDTLTLTPIRGPFRIECDVPGCPENRDNLVWRAAERVWRAAGGRGGPRDVHVRIRKRIPMQAGLGGGSSDAASALRAFALFWRAGVSASDLGTMAVALGADVPFFLSGGTTLGVDRGDLLFPLQDWPASWVVLAIPDVGVSTPEAFGWFDEHAPRVGRSRRSPVHGSAARLATQLGPAGFPPSELVNDLQAVVAERHPEIARLARALRRHGASHAAMSGSGSAVFGLFQARRLADAAAASLAAEGEQILVTRTIGRSTFGRLATPVVL